MSVELADFLLARTAEDEAAALADARSTHGPWDPSRALAECDAKRRIVERWRRADQAAGAYPGTEAGVEIGLYEAMTLLALPYACHADYRPEWHP